MLKVIESSPELPWLIATSELKLLLGLVSAGDIKFTYASASVSIVLSNTNSLFTIVVAELYLNPDTV